MPSDARRDKHPSGFLWGAALRVAARHRFKFSLPCESTFKTRLKTGLERYQVGLHEFAERKEEAQANVEKLVRAMVHAQISQNPETDILEEWTIAQALEEGKFCPGLWPIC